MLNDEINFIQLYPLLSSSGNKKHVDVQARDVSFQAEVSDAQSMIGLKGLHVRAYDHDESF